MSVGIKVAIRSPAPSPFCIVKIREFFDIILLRLDAAEPTPDALVAIINSSYPFASSMLFDTFIFLTTLSPLKPETLRPSFLMASKCSSQRSIAKTSLLF